MSEVAESVQHRTDPETHLRELLERIRRTDPELARQFDGALAADGETFSEGLAGDGIDPVKRLDRVSSIVLPEARPAIVVLRDVPVLRPNDADALIWRTRLDAAREMLLPVVRAVGRIELRNHFDLRYAGTGFLVRPNVLVTAYHVAHNFARELKRKVGGEVISELTFRRNLGNQPMEVGVDFLEESGSSEEETFRIARVLHLDKETEIALLEVDGVEENPVNGEPTGLPLEALLSEDEVAEQDVVVIGYPGKDVTIPSTETLNRLFGTELEKKRLSPGRIFKVTDKLLKHDCSTLSGSSGSPLVGLNSGLVVGLHLEGQYSVENSAIPAARILEALHAIGRA
jgi:endonuclease G